MIELKYLKDILEGPLFATKLDEATKAMLVQYIETVQEKVKTLTDNFTTETAELRSAIKYGEKNIKSAVATIEGMRETLYRTQEVAEAKIQGIQKEIDQRDAKIVELEADVKGLTQSIARLEKHAATTLDQRNAWIVELEEKLRSANKELSKAVDANWTIQKKLDATVTATNLRAKIVELEEKLRDTKYDENMWQVTCVELRAKIAELTAPNEVLRLKIVDLIKKNHSLEDAARKALNLSDDRLAASHCEVEALRAEIVDLQASVKKLSNNDSLSIDLDAYITLVEALRAKNVKLEENLRALISELRLKIVELEEMLRSANNNKFDTNVTISNLRASNATLAKQVKTLQGKNNSLRAELAAVDLGEKSENAELRERLNKKEDNQRRIFLQYYIIHNADIGHRQGMSSLINEAERAYDALIQATTTDGR